MKNKKLLVLLIIVAAVVVVTVVFVTVFTVRYAEVYYYNEDGQAIASPADAPSKNDVLALVGNKNIVFLSKNGVLSALNERFASYYAVALVKTFPNKVIVHLVRRAAVYKVNDFYLDSFGYVMSEGTNVIDITSAFTSPIGITDHTVGAKIAFSYAENATKLEIMCVAANTVWRLNYAFSDIADLISRFEFDADLSKVTIVTAAGAKIVVYSPTQNFENRLIKAFSVYYNDRVDYAKEGVVIYVPTSGNITTQEN